MRLVAGELTKHDHGDGKALIPEDAHALVRRLADRIVIEKGFLAIKLNDEIQPLQPDIRVPWVQKPGKPRREVIPPGAESTDDKRPIRSETRGTLLRAIARGRAWLPQKRWWQQ